ncbi:MAG: tRNA 2-selenouridine(34) synthase MnmH [Bacteroidetes bacterium]|nr:tRNA 2-selenouridine(34) synthase MnmH [Bacteroidota bacterium]MBS1631034.1 tRNA 2-selenouridine(34) synthase MnmH [Bacteroidota bacterium]
MAIEKINTEKFLELAKEQPVIDVRSPAEYKHAHIPGAYSLPLFTDEERKVVGTIYKQQSREAAIKIALDYFGPKMKKMIEEVEDICKLRKKKYDSAKNPDELINLNSKIVLLYCWRGGMRSGGVAWLMDLYGFKVYTLIGGYKKFRNYVLETFKLPFQFKILGGFTGSGKTEILRTLEKNRVPVIDLEKIANHKGSAFGNIGMPEQPGQETFENLLAIKLRKLFTVSSLDNFSTHTANSIWLEDESQRIGLINLPNDFWKTMRSSPLYFIKIPFEERLKHLVREYGVLDKQKMIDAIGRIKERLGGLNAKNAIQLLEEGNITESFRILLQYYDKYYLKALHNREGINSLLHTIDCESVSIENSDKLEAPLQYHNEDR